MAKTVTIENDKRTATVTLSGETTVIFPTTHPYFEVYNESGSDVVASIYPNKKAGDDGAITVHAGGDATLPVLKPNTTELYLTGSGKVQVVGKSTPTAIFNSVSVTVTGGGSTTYPEDIHEYTTKEDIDEMFGPEPEPDPGPDFANKGDIDNMFKSRLVSRGDVDNLFK